MKNACGDWGNGGGEEEAIDQVSLKATQLCQPRCLCQPFPELPAPGSVPASHLVCPGNCPAILERSPHPWERSSASAIPALFASPSSPAFSSLLAMRHVGNGVGAFFPQI